ncbi:hypothetical protein K466DRAFT_173592 [Polyporus arcularius HHB13444]|uniref:BAH domain-containing protein n=1 Tax=Polyporus arcularius HHB13444 TaxID=1314778 RepID=A0A5C3PIS8_9APHY|nr:hypothetical protein K466DRAFT_173592 [Polyporus arcularius HHB13444]
MPSMSTQSSKNGRRRRSRPLTLKTRKLANPTRKELAAAEIAFRALPCRHNAITIDVNVDDDQMPSEPFQLSPRDTPTRDVDGSRCKRTLFKRGDDVLLNSECDGSPNLWAGRIAEMRESADRSQLVVKVRWYFSPNDVAEHIKSFDTSTRSPYERILSDSFDYLDPETLQAVVYMHEYDEAELDPPQIGPTDLFTRSTLQYWRKVVKPLLGEDTCRCQVAYNPYPELRLTPSASFSSSFSVSSSQDAIMHFCPRLGCRKWYHASCLTTMRHVDTDSPSSTRGLRLLAVDPTKDAASADKLDIFRALELFDHSPIIVAHLPPSLLAIAQSPIVRCAGAPDGWAIGNVADVVLARRFVYAAIEHSGPPEATEAFRCLLQFQDDSAPYAEISEEAEYAMVQRLIDGLEGFDLLASVHAPYWERRWRQFVEMQVLFEGPAFECPQCKSAI